MIVLIALIAQIIQPADNTTGWVMIVIQLAMAFQLARLELKINARVSESEKEIALIKQKLKMS